VALGKRGFSQTAMAEQVGIAHATLWRCLAHDTFPQRQPCQRQSGLEAHLPFLGERWEAGGHNSTPWYRERVAPGSTQSYQAGYDQVMRLLSGGKKHAAKACTLSPTPLSSKSAAFLFLRRPQDLEADEQETLITLRQLDSEIELAYTLVQQFAQMLRTRSAERLDGWLENARASQLRERQGFALSVAPDKAAVLAGLTLPQNNAVVEGHVNKLKLIKRMGYGRAGLSLLRQRVLHAFSHERRFRHDTSDRIGKQASFTGSV
jgi:hypothetical protein